MKFYERILRELKHEEHSFKTIYMHTFEFRDHIAFEENKNLIIKRTSYSDMHKEVLRLTAFFRERFAKGSVIALVMPNSPLWVECFWAIFQSGCRALLLSPLMPENILRSCLDHAGCKAVLGDYNMEGFECLSKEFLISVSPKTPLASELDTGWGDEVIIATSSTTGAPKLYAYSGDAICKQILNSEYILTHCKDVTRFYKGHFRHLAFLPFSHVFGLTACYLWFAMFGITFVFIKDLAPETILGACRLHKVTHIFAVPLLWDTMAARIREEVSARGIQTAFDRAVKISLFLQDICPPVGRLFAGIAFKSVRTKTLGDSISYMISGGGMLKSETLPLINAMGYPLENGYGMTEIGIACLTTRKKPSARKGLSVGKPFPGLTFRLDDTGQLTVRGSSCHTASYENGIKTVHNLDEFFETGDIFTVSEEGEYFFKSRKDDLINGANGERLSPDMIEAQLNLSIPNCVFGMPDGSVFLVIYPFGAESPDQALSDALESVKRLPALMRIKSVFVSENPLPLSLSGKIRRRAIREGMIQGTYSADEISVFQKKQSSARTMAASKLTEEIMLLFKKSAHAECDVTPESNFFSDLGGDSLSFIELMSAIESGYNLKITDTSSIALTTPAACAEYVSKHASRHIKSA
ncbi:MAG: AMP-binding protein [Clostridia bacterium]|nr:AMP-binding protein [Clostridia bacterium]